MFMRPHHVARGHTAPPEAVSRRTTPHKDARGRSGTHWVTLGRTGPQRATPAPLDNWLGFHSPSVSRRFEPQSNRQTGPFFVWTLPGCRSLTESVFRRNDDGMGDHSLTSLLCVPEAVHWRTFEAKRRLPTFQNFLDFEFQLQPLQSSLHEQLLPLFRF